jgi:hypothetical protein
VVAKLRRDPSLRHKDAGRRLLLLLQANAAATQILPAEAGAVPPHCAAIVEQLARQYGRMWLGFAQELHERRRAIESADGARKELSHERKRMGP